MPEIGEVARIVHYLKKHVVSRRIANILTTEDALVYNAKANCTASSFAAALKGKKVLDAKQQGKYFWLEMESPPHPLMHFGMTGWVKLSNESTYYKNDDNSGSEEGSDASDSEKTSKKRTKGRKEEWPPRFWKFVLQMEGKPECEAAFVDGRRLARIRLVDCPADHMRKTTPLKENGPDPVVDRDVLTVEWLTEKMRKKKVPVKAFLLDQGNISGVGNWVADELLYHAKLHPEQYTNSFSDAQIKQLHDSLIYVTGFACKVLSDSSQFPEEWLFKHRWNAGKKGDDKNRLANGEKIVHIKVGGRTSAVVPSVQKKTGPVAADVDDDEDAVEGAKANGTAKKDKGGAKRKRKVQDVADEDEDEEGDSRKTKPKSAKSKATKKAKGAAEGEVKTKKEGAEAGDGDGEAERANEGADPIEATPNRRKKASNATPKSSSKATPKASTKATPKSSAKATARSSARSKDPNLASSDTKKTEKSTTPRRQSARLQK